MGRPLLEIRGLDAWYRRDERVLNGLSLTLAEHEVAGLIGLNGAGKTTLMNVLSGLLPTFRAAAFRFRGGDIFPRAPGFKAGRYTVFAEDRSFQYFTFREYLSYVFAAYRQTPPDVTDLVEGFHFAEYTDTLIRDLSTGSRKKAFLITAFALRPPLLLLDEPVNGLDFQSTEYLYSLISGYKAHGTVLFSSHVLESITLTADRVFVLENGGIRRSFEEGRIDAGAIREALHNENDL